MIMIYSYLIQYLPYICIICSIISSIISALGGKRIKCAWSNYSIAGKLLGNDKKDECK